MKSPQQQFLSKYQFNKEKPLKSATNYTVYNGVNPQSNLPVTIKTLKYPHVQLPTYLKKLKQCNKSQSLIRIYDIFIEQQLLILVTEQIIYGNLKKALEKCKYLDQPDAIFIAKQLLNGHVDLLRADCSWFGTEEDIEFSQDGQIRLSWNNGCSFNVVNPFPGIIGRFSNRLNGQGERDFLPFPLSKSLQQILRISKQNASQIAMSPQMKKKGKVAKKKGKNWVGIKQSKNKNQYFDQLSYLAIHPQHGFIRAKIYQQGKISPNLLQLNKTKPYFAHIFQTYQQLQTNKSIILSEYSNDGNLQSYVTRLKTAGVKLKQQQIQFFVYSLLGPLKQVQQSSSVKSICMLNIKNILIESGIPKIGQPIPLNQKILQVLGDRKDVPDFYHCQFKSQTSLRLQHFDTYSLGVLLYKLMYTQMPIFPEKGKVHIPTAPSYSKRLKMAVEILLTQKCSIRQIQDRIQMSQVVKRQIQQNNQKLKARKQGRSQPGLLKQEQGQGEGNKHEQEQEQSSSQDQNGNKKYQEEQQDQDEGEGYWKRFLSKIELRQGLKVQQQRRLCFVDQLQLSSFKAFRIWSKCVIILTLYIFVFYYPFIENSVVLLASQGLFTKIDLNLTGGSNPNLTVSVITTDRYQFQTAFNKTPRTIPSLQAMHCLLHYPLAKGPDYSFLKEDSQLWYGYLLGGLGSFLAILFYKVLQLHVLDDIGAWFRRQQGRGHLNICNWLLLNFHWLGLISGHYFLFNFIFEPQVQPCVGHKRGYQWGSTSALFNNHSELIAPFVVVFALQLFFFLLYLLMITKDDQLHKKYNKLFNTLTLFGTFLAITWLMLRFGVIFGQFYYPAAATDQTYIIINMLKQKNYVLFFAILPEALFVIEILCLSVVNWIYYTFVDKTQKLLNNQATLDASLELII